MPRKGVRVDIGEGNSLIGMCYWQGTRMQGEEREKIGKEKDWEGEVWPRIRTRKKEAEKKSMWKRRKWMEQ